MRAALQGIKILDLSRLLPFNYCTMMLADLGAEVLKMDKIQEVFLTKTRKEWLDIMEGKDICYALVNDIDDLMVDPQVKHRKMILEMDHPGDGKIPTIGFPFKFSKTPAKINTTTPSLGQHTDEILKKLGMQDKEIAELQEKGVI